MIKYPKYTVELEWDQVDAIMVKELKHIYHLESKTGLDGYGMNIEPDYKLLDAIETVLEYCMAPTEFETWKKNR